MACRSRGGGRCLLQRSGGKDEQRYEEKAISQHASKVLGGILTGASRRALPPGAPVVGFGKLMAMSHKMHRSLMHRSLAAHLEPFHRLSLKMKGKAMKTKTIGWSVRAME